ncbi:MAG: 50S ribosomal protein L25 [Candidatus Campbellbacteria bacterium]|nr:50S ribosomal protein L25 [Candidatus Campbellbacteria bacterium]
MSTISVEKRTERGKKLKELRSQGKIPAVFYGPKDNSEAITLSRSEFDSLLSKEGESSVVTLKGDDIEKDVLIQDIQTHPVTQFVEHVDFYVIDKTKKVEVSVPIEFVGESPAVKSLGGTLIKVLHELDIKVLPTDIPHEINVDVSELNDFESVIYARDLKLPEEVELMTNPDETVVFAEEPREEEPEETEEPASIDDIERVGEEDTEESSSEDSEGSEEESE